MNKYFLVIITIFLLTKGVYSQNVLDGAYLYHEKTIAVIDKRGPGVNKQIDTSTAGHKPGDVYVTRELWYDPYKDLDKPVEKFDEYDTMTVYIIHFIRPFKNELMNYQRAIGMHADFDMVTYHLLTDSVVSVTFINSSTKKKKSIQFSQSSGECCVLECDQNLKDWYDDALKAK